MGIKEDALALADELEGMDCREGCSTCPADGTKDCRGDLSCEEAVARATARRIREVVEHDACEDTIVSAYDLLPDEDRKAIAWVREMGGVEAAKASIHQGAMEHGYLLKVAEMLGTSIYDGSDNADALLDKLRKRLMPDGMEWLLEVWPKWSNGEYCKFGDWWKAGKYGEREPQQLSRLVFFTPEQLREWGQDEGENFGYEWDYMRPSDTTYRPDKVEPPAPKVLDADGVEIRVGDTVYHVKDGSEMTVYGIEGEWLVVSVGGRVRHDIVTHRAPVLAADGKPLRVGEKVCLVSNGEGPYLVMDITDGRAIVDGAVGTTPGEMLTHERLEADTWERLEGDAEKSVCDYFGVSGYCNDCPHCINGCYEELKRDLVRRARKLAERDA